MADTNGTLPPHSVEAEEAVIGAIASDPVALVAISDILKPQDFYIVRHSWAYEAAQTISARRETPDYISILDQLKQDGRLDEFGGPAALTRLLLTSGGSFNVETYAHMVERAAVRRKLLAAASEIAKAAHTSATADDAIADSERALHTATTRQQARTSGKIGAVLLRVQEDINRRQKLAEGGRHAGVPTGLRDVDAVLGGLQDSDLVIAAGRPGMGKTSWMLNVALSAARTGARVGVVSMEMSDEQLGQRFVAMDTGVTTDKMRTGRFTDQDWRLVTSSIGGIGNLPIFIDDKPKHTPSSLRALAWRWHYEHGLDLLMVDYIGLMGADGLKQLNDVQRVSQITRELKVLARELNIPVVAASQLNRQLENRQDKRPKLSDLRDSGSVEQDADVVLFIYRDEVYTPNSPDVGRAELIIAKHRNGPCDTVKVKWTGATTRFDDLTLRPITLAGAGHAAGLQTVAKGDG